MMVLWHWVFFSVMRHEHTTCSRFCAGRTLLNPAGHTGSAWALPLLDNGTIQTQQTKPRTLTQPTEQNNHLLIIYNATLEFGKHNN